jgi:mono/diheme cytochrome c family protein
MAVQPSVRPDEASAFFSDSRAQRPLPEGTVARGHLRIDRHLFTGKRQASESKLCNAVMNVGANNPLALIGEVAAEPSEDVDTFPFTVTRQVLEHGRDRYTIFCVVCHDPAGSGHGKIVERGYTQPPSFHIERLRIVPVGHFFEVMTNGYGSMPEYKQQIPPRDRWAIAGYIRALQLSQHFPIKDLPPELRQEWEKHQGGAAND